MPGRSVTPSDSYRYGHNGQEREKETFEGAYSAEYWGYDSRLVRRWEQDPVVKHWESPYACFNNNPIQFADPSGEDGEDINGKYPGDKGYIAPPSVDLPDVNIIADDLSEKGGIKWPSFENLNSSTGEVINHAKAFAAGALNAWGSNNLMGVGRKNPNELNGYASSAKAGQTFGDIVSLVQSGIEIVGGIAGEGVGLALDMTGVGALLGVPVGVASAVVITHGVLVGGTAISNLAKVDNVNDNIQNKPSSNGSSGTTSNPTFKKPKSGVSGKEGAKDVPSWAKGEKPYTSENGKSFARRLLDSKYGPGNYKTGPGTEYNQIQKWGDRAFE